MKKFTLVATIMLLMASAHVRSQTITTPRTPSPNAEITQTIGISDVTINYSRPAVRDREIWGTPLAHYGYLNLGFGTATEAPWRAGANENTIITFSHDAQVEGKDIPAGTYALFMGLHEDGKVDVIFSKNSTSWGSYFYDKSEDQLRVAVNMIDNSFTERLTFNFIEIDKTSATCVLDWENKRIPFQISFDVDNLVMANAANELRNQTGFGWQGPASAAQYALNNKLDMNKALAWADQSIAAQSNFNNLMLKSQIQQAMGNDAAAKETAEAALNDPGAGVNQYYSYGRQLINQDKDSEALALFTKLKKKWPDHWLAEHGMARAYSAMGDYKKALKYEKVAVTICPEGSKQFLEGYIALLEKGEDFN